MTISEQTEIRAVLRELYAAFAQGDIPSVLAAFDPQIVWTETAGGPFAGTYTGPNSVLENVFGPLGSEWDEFAVQPDAYVCDGDAAVVTGTYRGTYRPTGRTLEARFAHAWQLRDGRAVRFEQVTDTARWNDTQR
jgi:ketosteroid isomerase-like protein